MQQAKALKEQVDATPHIAAVLEARVQPWIDEAFVITTKIEGNLVEMQGTQEQIHGSSSNTAVLEQRVQEIQQAVSQCVADLAAVRAELEGLCVKIFTSTE